jgi:hypothetical protein
MPNKTRTDSPQGGLETAGSTLSDTLREEKLAATRALHDTRDDLGQKTSHLASEAKDAAFRTIEGKQHDIGSKLAAFGGALRAASEHLANSDQRVASRLMQDTAGGIDRLSSSLKDRSLEEMISEIRTFGRNHAGVVIAGSALAGLALGRLIQSTNAARSTQGSSASRKSGLETAPSAEPSRSDDSGDRPHGDLSGIGE